MVWCGLERTSFPQTIGLLATIFLSVSIFFQKSKFVVAYDVVMTSSEKRLLSRTTHKTKSCILRKWFIGLLISSFNLRESVHFILLSFYLEIAHVIFELNESYRKWKRDKWHCINCLRDSICNLRMSSPFYIAKS